MKTFNIIALQHNLKRTADSVPALGPGNSDAQQTDAHTISEQAPAPEQFRQLVEVVKLYRRQEQAYFEKVKRKVFAKNELHHMKETQQKLDFLLSTLNY